jgi:chemotaxis protein CheD
MSHFLLATRGTSTGPSAAELDARYADEALALMLRDLAELKIKPSTCQGKLFGGGNMFPEYARTEADHVGQRNGEAARALLAAHRIPILSENLFGVGHRQIIFDVSTGDVWSRQVKPKLSGDFPKVGGEEETKKP